MYSAIIASAFAAAALAAPTKRQASPGGPSDGVILNYALTLEHLENAFYKEVLERFTLADFQAVGLDNVFYNNLQQISSDEATHVEFLTTALTAAGVTPVVPNGYAFGITDVNSALALSNALEGVGVSAYLGAAQFISSGDYLTAAGSILTVEARHSAYIRDSQRPQQLSPFPSPFDTPLLFNEVFTLAAAFITQNNNPNADLPVMAFTALAYTGGPAAIGSTIQVTAAADAAATEAYFFSVTGPVQAQLTRGTGPNFSVTIPEGTPAGQSYLVLTSGGLPTDQTIVAGPAIVEIQDNQFGVTRDSPCKDGSAPSYGNGGKGGSAPSYGNGGSSGSAPSSGNGGSSGSAPSYSSGGSSSGAVKQIPDGQVQAPAYGADGKKVVVVDEDCEEGAPAYSH